VGGKKSEKGGDLRTAKRVSSKRVQVKLLKSRKGGVSTESKEKVKGHNNKRGKNKILITTGYQGIQDRMRLRGEKKRARVRRDGGRIGEPNV